MALSRKQPEVDGLLQRFQEVEDADEAAELQDELVRQLQAAIDLQRLQLERYNYINNVFPGHLAEYCALKSSLNDLYERVEADDGEDHEEELEIADGLSAAEQSLKDLDGDIDEIHSWLREQDQNDDTLAHILDKYDKIKDYIDTMREIVEKSIDAYDELRSDDESQAVDENLRVAEAEEQAADEELRRREEDQRLINLGIGTPGEDD